MQDQDFVPPLRGFLYNHRLFENVTAEVIGFWETRNGDGVVWFERRNIDTFIRTPSYWSLARFAEWFDWSF